MRANPSDVWSSRCWKKASAQISGLIFCKAAARLWNLWICIAVLCFLLHHSVYSSNQCSNWTSAHQYVRLLQSTVNSHSPLSNKCRNSFSFGQMGLRSDMWSVTVRKLLSKSDNKRFLLRCLSICVNELQIKNRSICRLISHKSPQNLFFWATVQNTERSSVQCHRSRRKPANIPVWEAGTRLFVFYNLIWLSINHVVVSALIFILTWLILVQTCAPCSCCADRSTGSNVFDRFSNSNRIDCFSRVNAVHLLKYCT